MINRYQFLKQIIQFFFSIVAFVNFPLANIKKTLSSKKNFKTLALPDSGPWPTSDPFLFCVHHVDNYPKANDNMGPDENLNGRNIGNDFSNKNGWSMYHGEKIPGFPRHPHRGFETITIVDKGLIDHSDSMGCSARYGDGDVQWLTAGDGIQHSEMFPLLNKNKSNKNDFFQIWINLKSSKKRVAPNFSMLWRDEIPKITVHDINNKKTEIEIIAGSYKGNNAPAPPPNSWANDKDNYVNIWKIKLDKNAQFILPRVNTDIFRSLYFYKGDSIIVNGQEIKSRMMIEVDNFDELEIASINDESYILLLQAKAINEPIVKYGPFVMNSREEIQEAFNDYQKTGFGDWDWDDDGPVHGDKCKKFAIGDN